MAHAFLTRLAAAGALAFSLAAAPGALAAARSHGMSLFGDLKYGEGFTHFDYVGPDAPKGGRIVMLAPNWANNQNPQTFNTLNGYVTKGDAPNFDMPPGTSTAIFDIADDLPSDSMPLVIDITATFAEQARGWSSALFPTKSKPPVEQSELTANPAPPAAEQPSPTSPAPFPFTSSPQDHVLFVPRVGAERPQ